MQVQEGSALGQKNLWVHQSISSMVLAFISNMEGTVWTSAD